MFNSWLNLADCCLADKSNIPLKVIASFSAVRFARASIPLIVLHSLVRSVFWSMVSNKISPFAVYVRRCVSGCLYVITSSISAGTGSSWIMCRPVGMWCDATFCRTLWKIFSSLWQFVGRERVLLYLSQLPFLG